MAKSVLKLKQHVSQQTDIDQESLNPTYKSAVY